MLILGGLRLLFLPNVPGATFIQGGTSIPESRVIGIGLTDRSNLGAIVPLTLAPWFLRP